LRAKRSLAVTGGPTDDRLHAHARLQIRL